MAFCKKSVCRTSINLLAYIFHFRDMFQCGYFTVVPFRTYFVLQWRLNGRDPFSPVAHVWDTCHYANFWIINDFWSIAVFAVKLKLRTKRKLIFIQQQWYRWGALDFMLMSTPRREVPLIATASDIFMPFTTENSK